MLKFFRTNNTRYFFVPAWLLLLAACHTVRLTVRNVDAVPITASVVTDSARPDQSLGMGDIAAGGSKDLTFKIKNNHRFTVAGSLDQVQVFKSDQSVPSAAPNPDPISVDLKRTGRILDDQQATQTLQNSFSKMGPDIGFDARDLTDALQTLFGGLLVITPPQQGDTEMTVHFSLTPAQFSNVVAIGDVHTPGDNIDEKIDISSSAAVNIAATVPFLAQLGFTDAQSSVYNVHWNLSGFGFVDKVESPTFSVADKSRILMTTLRPRCVKRS